VNVARIALICALAAGCTGSPAPAAPEVAAPPATAPTPPAATPAATSAPWDPLFVQGHAWTFTVTSTDEHWDDQDPQADKSGNVKSVATSEVTCTVDKAGEAAGTRTAHVSCTGPLSGSGAADPLAGTWLANAQGVWFLGELDPPTDTPAVPSTPPFLPDPPVEAHVESSVEPDVQGSESRTVTHKDGAWCVAHAMSMGDDGWTTLCLDATGPSSGNGGWAGGSSHEATFTRKGS
jgi:hypothetical protein